jgi:hypothetical protein
VYNLNYTATALEVQSWREITCGGTRKKELNTFDLESGMNRQLRVDDAQLVLVPKHQDELKKENLMSRHVKVKKKSKAIPVAGRGGL